MSDTYYQLYNKNGPVMFYQGCTDYFDVFDFNTEFSQYMNYVEENNLYESPKPTLEEAQVLLAEIIEFINVTLEECSDSIQQLSDIRRTLPNDLARLDQEIEDAKKLSYDEATTVIKRLTAERRNVKSQETELHDKVDSYWFKKNHQRYLQLADSDICIAKVTTTIEFLK